METSFYKVLDNAFNEIALRAPNYFKHFEVEISAEYVAWVKENLNTNSNRADENKLQEGLAYLEGKGIKFQNVENTPDPVGRFLLTSIVDASSPEAILFAYINERQVEIPLKERLKLDYKFKKSKSGLTYLIRHRGSIPLLLINALGIPLAMWESFLMDITHDFKIILCENQCGDIVDGGMKDKSSFVEHSQRIKDILEEENIKNLNILAWCNAGRIAVHLASLVSNRISSLILVSTTFRGIQNVEPLPCLFEDNLQKVFNTIRDKPSTAPILIKMLGSLVKTPDWGAMKNDLTSRVELLFSLPHQKNAAALLTPMNNADFLFNYGERTYADELYPIHTLLQNLTVPMLLITGANDNVVNNVFIFNALSTYVKKFYHANIQYAGHYVHELQYPYFRFILNNFLRNFKLTPNINRIRIQEVTLKEAELA